MVLGWKSLLTFWQQLVVDSFDPVGFDLVTVLDDEAFAVGKAISHFSLVGD